MEIKLFLRANMVTNRVSHGGQKNNSDWKQEYQKIGTPYSSSDFGKYSDIDKATMSPIH